MTIEFLTAIILWCAMPNATQSEVMECRARKFDCYHRQFNVTAADFARACLFKPEK